MDGAEKASDRFPASGLMGTHLLERYQQSQIGGHPIQSPNTYAESHDRAGPIVPFAQHDNPSIRYYRITACRLFDPKMSVLMRRADR